MLAERLTREIIGKTGNQILDRVALATTNMHSQNDPSPTPNYTRPFEIEHIRRDRFVAQNLKRAVELNDQDHDSYIFVEGIFDTSR